MVKIQKKYLLKKTLILQYLIDKKTQRGIPLRKESKIWEAISG